LAIDSQSITHREEYERGNLPVSAVTHPRFEVGLVRFQFDVYIIEELFAAGDILLHILNHIFQSRPTLFAILQLVLARGNRLFKFNRI